MAEKENSMLCRKFFLTVDSAKNLPNVRMIRETAAYAQVLVGSPDGKTTKSETNKDDRNGANPVWNHPMKFQISEDGVHHYGLSLTIKVYTRRGMNMGLLDGYIGEVNAHIKDLYDEAFADGGTGDKKCELPIKNGTDETGATLSFCYSFGKDSFLVEKNKFLEKAIRIARDTMDSAVRFSRESSTDEKKEAAIKIGAEVVTVLVPIVVPAVIAVLAI